MARGRSLHIGLNSVDPDSYGGWAGTLAACEFDAHDMRDICAAQGFQTSELLTGQATAQEVLAALGEAAAALRDGDLFVVSYAGHGGQLPDAGGEEPDQLDETWVLFDRQLVDDELYAMWGRFAAGVRVVVLSDSCHSGSVVKAQLAAAGGAGLVRDVYTAGRFMPWDDNLRDYTDRQGLYDGIRGKTSEEGSTPMNARVLLLSGCQDNQTSMDGPRNGAFTGRLREVWADGAFSGGYRRFLNRIKDGLPPWQSPNYMPLNDPRHDFDRERPFTVQGSPGAG